MYKNRGFTLMEIMIVISIISILVPLLTPIVSTYIARARDASRVADLQTIKRALMLYEQQNDKYPITFAMPNGTHDFLSFHNLFSIDNVSAIGGGGGGGVGCPMISIFCSPGFEPYQDPLTCINSCIPATWTRTDDQCASYLNDPKFVQIIGKIPKDPQQKKPFPCLDTGDVGSYGYATATGSDENQHFIVTAELESAPMANVGYNAIQSALVTGDLELLKDKPKGSYVDTPGDTPYYVEYE